MSSKGSRLDVVLPLAVPHLSRSQLKGLIDEGWVRVNGAPSKPGYRLKGGELLEVLVPKAKPTEAQPEELPLDILFEDEELLVINKAAGMVVHPAAGHWSGTLVNALLHRLSGDSLANESGRAGLVHRLDKDTSGCLVVAKTLRSLEALQQAFKARTVTKVYWALVLGAPPRAGTFSTLHGRHPTHRKKFSSKVKTGKQATTHFRTLEYYPQASWVEVTLETGRTHQIRVHFSEAGFPLLADPLYGAKRRVSEEVQAAEASIGRTALHARRLEFQHPVSRKTLSLEAPAPQDWLAAQARLNG